MLLPRDRFVQQNFPESNQTTPASGPPAHAFKAARQPMLWAAAAYSLGIVTGVYAWRPISWWLFAGGFFVLAAAYFARRRSSVGWTLGLAALFFAGAMHIQVRSHGQLDTSIVPYSDREELQIVAHAVHDGRVQSAAFGETRQTLDVEAEEIQTAAGQTFPMRSGIRLSIYGPRSDAADGYETSDSSETNPGNGMRTFHYGDRIRFVGKLRLPHNFRNPGAFDYQGYLSDRGILALGSAKIEDVELLPGFSGSRLAELRSRLHRGVIAKVHQLWPAREAALIDAMVIGEEAFIDRDTRLDFQRSGTYHVLVVSGMNVGILAFVVFWTLRKLRLPDIPATLLTV
jgi:competence protein ComEC